MKSHTKHVQANILHSQPQLHQLALCFYEDECKPENLIEYHIFEYSYNDDRVTLDLHSKSRHSRGRHSRHTEHTFESVRERTVHLIRACVVIMQSCQTELPAAYDVSLRLYYNQDAPSDYQAPGFLSTDESEDHLEPYLVDAIKLGWVETPYHKLIARSFIKEHVLASHEAIPSQNRPILSNEVQASGSNIAPDTDIQIVCPCNRHEEGCDVSELLKCLFCGTYQHACCYGVCDVTAAASHCCVSCYQTDTHRTPTDKKLATLTHAKRESLCIFRRTLEWCARIPSIDGASISQRFRISETNAHKLMRLLHSHGVLPEEPTDSKTPQKIITVALNSVMSKFFNMNRDVVERLLAETLLEESDPLSGVISPFEQVSLTSDGNKTGVTTPDTNRHTQKTLDQYKQAFSAEDDVTLDENRTKRKLSERNLRKGVRTKRSRLQ
ncbi:uncharacterized protein LOC116766605 [Danaus plexippus]|uniref:uncharacterized protein LOC116766605 n=1 Tax=Danaus plexippus TaxID=13037 RepID=UPI002AB1C204|nr:uncharacterized protein LOC116766605 [Danaus plexippus]